jgi:hypothetical protein
MKDLFMTPQKAAVLNIIISLMFAAAIISVTCFSDDATDNNTITFLLIALWFIPFSLLSGFGKNKICQKNDK